MSDTILNLLRFYISSRSIFDENDNREYDLIEIDSLRNPEILDRLMYDGFCIVKSDKNVMFKVDKKRFELLKLEDITIIKRNNGHLAWMGNEQTPGLIPMHDREMLDHVAFIVSIARLYNVQSYLELGVCSGPVLMQLSSFVPTCYGVDILPIKATGFTLFQMTTDDFFESNNDFFDMIFIDANHDYPYVQRDLNNAFQRIRPGGFVFLHDTYPKGTPWTIHEQCSDAYKIIPDIREKYYYPGIATFVNLPFHPGLTIMRRMA